MASIIPHPNILVYRFGAHIAAIEGCMGTARACASQLGRPAAAVVPVVW